MSSGVFFVWLVGVGCCGNSVGGGGGGGPLLLLLLLFVDPDISVLVDWT